VGNPKQLFAISVNVLCHKKVLSSDKLCHWYARWQQPSPGSQSSQNKIDNERPQNNEGNGGNVWAGDETTPTWTTTQQLQQTWTRWVNKTHETVWYWWQHFCYVPISWKISTHQVWSRYSHQQIMIQKLQLLLFDQSAFFRAFLRFGPDPTKEPLFCTWAPSRFLLFRWNQHHRSNENLTTATINHTHCISSSWSSKRHLREGTFYHFYHLSNIKLWFKTPTQIKDAQHIKASVIYLHLLQHRICTLESTTITF